VLGTGKRLFGETSDKKPLRLADAKTVGEGVSILIYQRGGKGGVKPQPPRATPRSPPRSDSFMSNAVRWLPQIQSGSTISEPFADVAVATNDPRDIAAVASVALLADEPEGRAHRITGPEALRPAERVAILSEVLGRQLQFEPLTNEEARQQMSANMPREYVDAFFRLLRGGVRR
jgi:hypothetical protein